MKLFLGIGLAFGCAIGSAQAASLPPPAKLCALIAAKADEGNDKIAKWQRSGNAYFCRSDGMSSLADGVVYMNTYQATGPTAARAQGILFQLKMYDSMLRKDQISQLILPRITAMFEASHAGPVPDDLIQAINNAAPTSVSTTLGIVQTRLTQSNQPGMPYNGAVFEVELAGLSTQPASALSRDENIARCEGTGVDPEQSIASCTILMRSSKETPLFLASAHCNRGNAYFAKGLMAKAISDFTKAIALQPDAFQPRHNRGHVYEKMGQPDKAIADYRAAYKLKPADDDTVQALKRLGVTP